jgi:hypothetical protein
MLVLASACADLLRTVFARSPQGLNPPLLASTLESDVGAPLPSGTERVRSVSGGRHAQRLSNLGVVAYIVVPRLLVAVLLSALTERASSVGTSGPAVRGIASGFLNWDAAHYLAIAEHGYRTVVDAPFFPLQPLLDRAFAEVLGYPNAAIAVSWVALGFAAWGILDVATRLTSRSAAVAATLLFVWNPVSVFLVTGYAQSLYIALTIWSLRFCLQRRWAAAAVVAGAAGAVVPPGALAGVVVVVGILTAERGVRRAVLAVVCAVVSEWGLIGWLLYNRARFGYPTEFERSAAAYWHNKLTYPFHIFFVDVHQLADYGIRPLFTTDFIILIDAAASLAALAAIVVAVVACTRDRRWLLPTLLLIMSALLTLSVTSAWGEVGSARYVSSFVTLWLAAAYVFDRVARRTPTLAGAVILLSAGLAVYIEAQFHMVYWII